MKLLIKKARIVSPSSPTYQADILIKDGVINDISDTITEKTDITIEEEGLCVSPGWMDIFANFGEPGYEYKETIESGAAAAAKGGFTDVAIIPNTKPVTDSKAYIEFIKGKSMHQVCRIHPIGAITKNAEGKELTEMYDMHSSGAVAFSDGVHSLQSPGIMLKALQYVLPVNACIIQLPEDKSIGAHGLMNEGIISTQIGLPGKPAIAEELMIAANIELAKYTGSKLHFTGISTKRSIELISEAKKSGVAVSCSVSPAHLFFCDEDLQQYDTNLKLNLPLRTRADRDALITGIKNGDIDCLASHHLPNETDSKICEFEYAKNGMIGLETMFAVAMQCGIDAERFVAMQAANAKNILGLPPAEIKKGSKACITLFNPDGAYIFTEDMIASKSKNSAFIGKQLKGKVIGIINGDKHIVH